MDFESDGDGDALPNGKEISDPAIFGARVSVSGSGPNAGPAIFDSTPGGPNDPSQDRDLLVGKGNLLILQSNDAPSSLVQTVPGIFERPNDDAGGGTIMFSFDRPTRLSSIDLIDIDSSPSQGAEVTLTDTGGATRVYTIPSGWTEDIQADGPPGFRTLDLTVLAPQPGFASAATASEDAGFDPDDVLVLEVLFRSSGALDDLTCATQRIDGIFTRIADQRPPQLCDPLTPSGDSASGAVALSNGEAHFTVTDLEVPSRGFPFRWTRSYSSRADFDFGHGHNWNYSYQRRVVMTPGGDASVVDGLGREDLHRDAGGGSFSTPATIYETLARNPDDTFTQAAPDGMRYEYDAGGYLASMEDRNGNRLTIERNSFHNITKIHDTQDREYTVAYTDGTPDQRVESVTDFMGREVRYTYDADGDLTRVRSPVVTGTPNGNDFPAGKTTLYTYTSGFSDSRLDHNLLTIVDPAHNVGDDPALSRPSVTLTYSPDTDPASPEFDRVAAERWGHDEGGPPGDPLVVVGGTTSFEYTQDLSGDPMAPPAACRRTDVTDRNRNERAYYYDATGHEVMEVERTNRDVRPGEGDHVTRYTYTHDGLLSSVMHPRGNHTSFLYDDCNPDRRRQGNLLERREESNGIGGGGPDLVTRYTYDPVFNQLRTMTDPRAFPEGTVPLLDACRLDLDDPSVERYTTTYFYDYQEGSGYQAAAGIAPSERIPESLGDLNGAADFDEGNLVRVEHPTIQTSGPDFGDASVQTATYNDRGQVATRVDPEGHVTRYEYFTTNGNPSDPSDLDGYLRSQTVDSGAPPHFNLTTSYSYDFAGNPTSVIDPRGHETTLFRNVLNQVVRALSRPPSAGTRYRIDTFYDANDNVVRIERSNQDENGDPYPHAVLTDRYEYSILNYLVAVERDKTRNDGTEAGAVRTEYSYDANLNRVAVVLPLAASGSELANIGTYRYDERDLLYKTTTGDDDTDPSNVPPSSAAVVTRNYDANGNLLERIDSLPHAQSPSSPVTQFPGSAGGDVTRYTYDVFDRLTFLTDPEGNERRYIYDAASNRIRERLRGPVDHLGGAPTLLTRVDTVYDELNRVVRSDALHFETATGVPIDDGHSVTEYEYDLDGKTVRSADDRGLETSFVYDTADRSLRIVDHLGNQTEFTYDANSNVITSTRRDVSTDLGSPPETFVTRMVYDGLDRMIRTVDPVRDLRDYFYDSRDNVVKQSDGVRGGTPLVDLSGPGSARRFTRGGPGNVVRYEYDGLNRLVRTERLLTTNGRGDGSPAGSIVTTQTWDDDSRLVAQTDDNGHTTSYAYDALNRLTAITYADGTARTSEFDTDDHVTGWTDQNGTECAMTYDGLDRLLSRSILRAPGVVGSTAEAFGYDGASRLTLARNDDGIHPGTMDCLFRYDSLSNRTRDQQGGLAVDSLHDGVSNRVRCIYPGQFGGGCRVLDYTYDDLNRLESIVDPLAGTVASLDYKGPVRLERKTHGNGTRLDVAYDAVPRPIDLGHTTGGGGSIARFQYGHDREHHRLFEKRVHDGNRGDVYAYDSIYRITRNLREVDLGAVAASDEIRAETYSSPDALDFVHDGVGNRTTTTETVAAAPTVTTYAQDPGAPLFDAEVNQYTSVSGGLDLDCTYDSDGNLTSDGERTYAYDFKNRLVEVADQTTTAPIVRYTYDAADRRLRKELFPSGPVTEYIFDGTQVVEERDGLGALVRQYVWGAGVDELVEVRTTTAVLHAHENSIGSIAALTDPSGAVVERYQYDPFGNTTVTLDGGTGNEYRFHAARFDPETGLYYMRARYYRPELGRFLQRDPIGVWTDDVNLGNALAFAGNNAIHRRDPHGADSGVDRKVESMQRRQRYTEAERLDQLLKLQPNLDQLEVRKDPDGGVVYSYTSQKLYQRGTAEYELRILNEMMEEARREMYRHFEASISQGFLENAFGFPNCTEQTERILQVMSNRLLKQDLRKLVHYEVVSIVSDPGKLSEHIYLGLRRKSDGKIIAFVDTWRDIHRYGGWTPIGEDTRSHDEVGPTSVK